jgi:Raf kinase inhibitor-like YbhB/YbcL family protein
VKKIYKIIFVLFFLFENIFFLNGDADMKLTSPVFENNQYIPKKYSGEGQDINPPLVIENIPVGAKSLVLIVDDPDAPRGIWVHWVVFDIPVNNKIEENSVPGKLGITDSGKRDYHGPNPPSGIHRYFFKIYALDKVLNLKEGINKQTLESTMKNHVLDTAELVGLYKRGN